MITSLDISPTKGLDIKPLYSWFHADGQTSGTARRNCNPITAGGTLNAAAGAVERLNPPAAGSPRITRIATRSASTRAGGSGRFGLDPTFYYQWGRTDTGIVTGPARTVAARRRSRPT